MKEKLDKIVIVVNKGVIQSVLSDKKVEVHLFDFDNIERGDEGPNIFTSYRLTKKGYNELMDDVASYDPYKGE